MTQIDTETEMAQEAVENTETAVPDPAQVTPDAPMTEAMSVHPEPPMPQNSEPEMPMSSEPVMPQSSEPALPMSSEPVMPQNSEPAMPMSSELVIPQNTEPEMPMSSEPAMPMSSEPPMPASSEPAMPLDQAENHVTAVPRISIQAFCETPATMEVLQGASSDRRLSRAHVSVQLGGIAGAASAFSNMPTPNLIIVESSADRDTMMADLGRLSEVCDSGTKVVVIGHMNDVILYRSLIDSGVSEYIVAPINILQIIDSISNLYNDPEAAPVGRVMAFIGAKGGCGSSTIAHNTAWAISEHLYQDAVIIDLDLAFGTAGLNLNQDPPQGIAEALLEPDRLDDVLLDRLLTKCTDRLSLFAAPGTIERDYEFDGQSVDAVIDIVRTSVPYIIVDIPHLWAPWTKHMMLQADEIIITAVPDLANLRNAKNLVDVMKASRPNDAQPRLVINQTGVPKRPEIGVDDFTSALELEPSVIIPYEPQLFSTAANNGQMIDEVSGNSKTADSFHFLAQRLMGKADEEDNQKRSFLSPLLSKFSGRKNK